MVKLDWQSLEYRRNAKDRRTLDKILGNDLTVDYKKFTITNKYHGTRSANIRHQINTDAMKYSFFNRTMKF